MFFMKLSCQGNESRLSECIKLSEAFEYIFDDIHDYSSGTKIQCGKYKSVMFSLICKYECCIIII